MNFQRPGKYGSTGSYETSFKNKERVYWISNLQIWLCAGTLLTFSFLILGNTNLIKYRPAEAALDVVEITASPENLPDVNAINLKSPFTVLNPNRPSVSDHKFWIIIFGVFMLLCLAAVMAGLTVGLMSIDDLKLNVVEMTGSFSQKRRVRRLAPLLKQNREQLLISIIIVNCICMEWVPTLLHRIFTETFTLIISVSLVLIFGEILPQVLCLQRPIACGANFV